MSDRRIPRRVQLVVAAVAAGVYLFQCEIFAGFFGIALTNLAWLGFAGTTGLLALRELISALRRRDHAFWSASALFVVLGLGFPFTLRLFRWPSASLKLLRYRSEYLAMVERADRGDVDPEIYTIEEGRIGFGWGGVASSWWGIVHDRSQTFGDVREGLFIGSTEKAWRKTHLWGPWYHATYKTY
jgi:hypothetical protein